jgi:FkbM family methyltransferase
VTLERTLKRRDRQRPSRHPYFIAQRRLQPAYNLLLQLALAGLNIGIDGGPARSGERAVLRVLLRDPARQQVVLDVGANVGNYAVEVLNVAAPSVLVHCFEPSVYAFAELSRRFRGISNVLTHNFGLGALEESVPMYADAPGSPLSSTYARRLGFVDLEMRPQENVILRRLDTVCQDLAIDRIDLLKLDVEGAELSVLHGAGELLQRGAIRSIQFEFGGCNIDSRTFFRDFWELLSPEYRMYRVVHDGLAPITRYRERLEQFVTTNFVALRR